MLTTNEALSLAEEFVLLAAQATDCDNPDQSWLKGFRKEVRDSCIEIIQEAKMEEFRQLATDVYRYLLSSDTAPTKVLRQEISTTPPVVPY